MRRRHMRGMAEGQFTASAQLKLPMAISNGTTIFQTQQIISEAPVSVYTGFFTMAPCRNTLKSKLFGATSIVSTGWLQHIMCTYVITAVTSNDHHAYPPSKID